VRLGLAEFSDHVRHHVDTIISSQDTLRALKTLFNSGDQVWPAECEDVIECLTYMSKQNRMVDNFIRRSNHLPLAVVPLRLPLIMVLLDEDTQIAKLKRLLVVLRNEGWTTLDQPVEQLIDIKDELDVLLVKSNDVLDQIGILLDRARFKEREYSIA
jgi:hypothetical protein